jgi:hypothetical protein
MRIVAIVLLGLALLAGGARAQQAGTGWLGVELADLTKAERTRSAGRPRAARSWWRA